MESALVVVDTDPDTIGINQYDSELRRFLDPAYCAVFAVKHVTQF